MNVNSLIGKATRNIDNLGKIVGFAYGAQKSAPSGKMMEHIEWMISQGMKDPHFPNVSHIFQSLTTGATAAPLKETVKVALLGEILSYLKVGGKYANLIKRGGWNAALGVIIFDVVAHATMWHSPGQTSQGGSGASAGNSPSWRYQP